MATNIELVLVGRRQGSRFVNLRLNIDLES